MVGNTKYKKKKKNKKSQSRHFCLDWDLYVDITFILLLYRRSQLVA